jgi:DNA-binding NarL/FixJ family response regulator
LVDDQEAFICALVAVVDATRGFVVVGRASTGEQSLKLADELRPALVLMDVNLPGIDGIEPLDEPANVATQPGGHR